VSFFFFYLTVGSRYIARKIGLTPEKALKILSKISPEHAKLMGFGANNPSWMIWTVLPIVPPSERPSIQLSPQRKGEDDLTCAAFAIKKCDMEVAKKIAQGCHAR
jgi:DNA-directed RNA polymerase subunit A'